MESTETKFVVTKNGDETVTGAVGPVVRLEYVVVTSEEKNSSPVELPLDEEGCLPLSTLHIEYPSSNGLKYINPTTGLFRIIAPDKNGRLAPPPIGWKNSQFVACNSSHRVTPLKRPLLTDEPLPPPKFSAVASGSGVSSSVNPNPLPLHVYDNEFRPKGSGLPVGSGAQGGYIRTTPMDTSPFQGPVKAFDHCSVCSCDLNSAGQAEMHYSGKKHLEALGRGGVASRGRGRGFLAPNMSGPSITRGSGRGLMRGGGGGRGILTSPMPNGYAQPQYDFTDDSVAAGTEFNNYSGYNQGMPKLGSAYMGR